MLQRLPPTFYEDSVCFLLDSVGLAGSYDVVHVPLNRRSTFSMRFAFVNFLDAKDAARCMCVCVCVARSESGPCCLKATCPWLAICDSTRGSTLLWRTFDHDFYLLVNLKPSEPLQEVSGGSPHLCAECPLSSRLGFQACPLSKHFLCVWGQKSFARRPILQSGGRHIPGF